MSPPAANIRIQHNGAVVQRSGEYFQTMFGQPSDDFYDKGNINTGSSSTHSKVNFHNNWLKQEFSLFGNHMPQMKQSVHQDFLSNLIRFFSRIPLILKGYRPIIHYNGINTNNELAHYKNRKVTWYLQLVLKCYHLQR